MITTSTFMNVLCILVRVTEASNRMSRFVLWKSDYYWCWWFLLRWWPAGCSCVLKQDESATQQIASLNVNNKPEVSFPFCQDQVGWWCYCFSRYLSLMIYSCVRVFDDYSKRLFLRHRVLDPTSVGLLLFWIENTAARFDFRWYGLKICGPGKGASLHSRREPARFLRPVLWLYCSGFWQDLRSSRFVL